MISVGVIGLGMMGNTHLDVYAKRKDVRVVAIADADVDRLSGKAKAQGNVKGQAQGAFDLASVKKYTEGMDLIADAKVQVVDVCLPTPMHRAYAEAALAAGKHLLIEKPLCRTAKDAFALAAAAKKAKGLAMPAMCMRFWPGWTWLKEAIADQRFGKCLAATFRRVASHPGGFYVNGEMSGGAILDLHIHDVDFVQWLFGVPAAVTTQGYAKLTGKPDHVFTQYEFADKANTPALVAAEGGWVMAPGFGFNMAYTANFEKATAVFDLGAPQKLMLYQVGREPAPVALSDAMGYELEIAYFVECIAKGRKPETVTLADAAMSVQIVEAEAKSMQTGKRVEVKA
jgi:predicted dehydrogenase